MLFSATLAVGRKLHTDYISVHCRDFEQQTLQLQERQQSLFLQVASLQEANVVSSERAGDHSEHVSSLHSLAETYSHDIVDTVTEHSG